MLQSIIDFFNLKKKSKNSYVEYVGYLLIGVILIAIGKLVSHMGQS